MFTLNDDLSIYATRGDIVFFFVTTEDKKTGKAYKFQPGDVVRIKVYGKKDAENVVLQKDFPVTEITEKVAIYLTKDDMKIGDVISKQTDYWYEVVLNDDTTPQTIIGYDEDGAKLFRLFPEGDDVPPYTPEIKPEDIPIVDSELDLTSTRPIENQAVARAIAKLEADYGANNDVLSIEVSPTTFGAIGDGVVDDTRALQTMIDVAAKETKCVRFPFKKNYYIENTLLVPDGVSIDFNYSTIETIHDIDVPAIQVSGSNVELHNLYLKEKNPDGSDNTGLVVYGGLSNINLNNICTDGFNVGIEITSLDETLSKNVKVKNCSAINAGSYGLYISYCDGCYVENFNGCHNRLDGLKAGVHCSNVYVNGGECSYNGVPTSEGGTGYGDGIDLYAGGYKFKITGITCKGNLGAGIHIMNGIYNIEGREEYNGCVVGDVVISDCIIENNGGNGVDAVVLNETPNAPKPQNIIITNNCMLGNGRGVQLDATDCVVSNNVIKDTTESGIYIVNCSRIGIENNTIVNPVKQGIYVCNGKDITISKGFIVGKGDSMLRAIMLDNSSNDNSTLIENVVMQNYTENCPVLVTNKQTYPNTKNVIKLHKVQESKLTDYYGFSAGSTVVVDGKAYYKNTDDINRADFYKVPLWRCGVASLAGNGSTTTFRIPHGCNCQPDIFNVTPRVSQSAVSFTVQCDETDIVVQFKSALPSGNWSVNWYVWF